MKLNNKKIDDIIVEVVGEDALPLVKMLKNKKNVSEFKIAESIKRQINETRNTLYRLYHANLVTFIRKKDKKKGWYIYYWTYNPKMLKHLSSNLKKQRFERLNERLVRERSNTFFSCSSSCIRLNFEQSTDFNYKCPECGEIMNQEENAAKITELEAELRSLEKEMKKV